MKLFELSVKELRRLLVQKEVSPLEVVENLLCRIAEVDPKIFAYIYLNHERALEASKKADISLPLGGVPVAIKDNINVLGEPCRCASRILEGYLAPYDSTVIEKLKKAGAILLGRTNMDEFAMGSSTENSSVGITRNPWNTERVPGGSSGGSAAAVAAHEAFCALGSDTGGSIRQPAAFCGCVGLKPTYGRVSRYGLTAFASSLDQIGPITKTVEDAALLLEVISGFDPFDNTSEKLPVPRFSELLENRPLKDFVLGIPKEYFIEGIDGEVRQALSQVIGHYEKLGVKIEEVSLPHTPYAVATYYILATAEASANLARFDGIRYGKRAKNYNDLIDYYGKTRDEGFGSEVKRRILLGTYVLSSGYYDAYYLRALKVKEKIKQDFSLAFQKCQALLTPTSPFCAFRIGEKTSDPLQMYLADIFTIAVNLAGICALSIPCGRSTEGLPIGFQLIGPAWKEETILALGYIYQKTTGWVPPLPPLGGPTGGGGADGLPL
ncbi:Asp-tRNA(Asn)/Glu-tRNA(Gln) amidotransferase subunit GatA [Candidatus Methylacidiphilum infernorum]|uniref:Glutamyl-tRNA(Gln) amidotransferase subunit A n=1 Tax=Methylacidiphilum infernorum (isolate V4) TaxID=481448 RepID=GATA_METI4|nr:Asp-tRNA(Asn)/Glu-tRNA(Gln) amidotransferase subunit GatA [Candidatus Methylacidiphilum infernorum]B3DWT4.1 RecName: Full=Glutamyl-tRNA(Gln) amidotransferase subunit A; Short=Glu-ADT subunit A [Methylacidiphilum infernorum V4]ACD83747.1 Asp-tRNAAsn/Glu-tRNAGln amidotransferase A subunit [Methylacidiphilum infernorum V4]